MEMGVILLELENLKMSITELVLLLLYNFIIIFILKTKRRKPIKTYLSIILSIIMAITSPVQDQNEKQQNMIETNETKHSVFVNYNNNEQGTLDIVKGSDIIEEPSKYINDGINKKKKEKIIENIYDEISDSNIIDKSQNIEIFGKSAYQIFSWSLKKDVYNGKGGYR